MAGDNLGIIDVQPRELGSLGRDIFVARAMESISADTVFVIIFLWQGIHVCI